MPRREKDYLSNGLFKKGGSEVVSATNQLNFWHPQNLAKKGGHPVG